MDKELGKVAEEAHLQYAARMEKMRSIVAMFHNVNPHAQLEIKEETDPWSSQKHIANPQVENPLKDSDTLSPTDTEYHSDSSKHSPIGESNMNEAAISRSSEVPPVLACPIPVSIAHHSPDVDPASQTPSSVNSSSPRSSEAGNIEEAKSPRGTKRTAHVAGLPDIGTDSTNPTGRPYLGLKVEVTEGIIAANASFRSFDEFERVFNIWKATYLHPFRVASSEQLRNADGTVDEVFKYKYIVYHCAHYGKPRMREKSPTFRRTQLQNALRDQKRENMNTSVLSDIQDTNTRNSPNESAAIAPTPWDTSLSLLAKNVAQIGKTADEGTNSAPQGVYQPCQPQYTSGIQNLAAVAAAVGHHQQQQQMAAAFLSQQKENMGFGFSKPSMMQQVQNANGSPALLPLIRGALGLPNFGSPLGFPLQAQVGSGQSLSPAGTGSADLQLPTPMPTTPVPSSNLLAASQPQQTSAFAQFLGFQQQQYLQQQNFAAALSLAQSLRSPFLNPSLVVQAPATSIPQPDTAQFPEAALPVTPQIVSADAQSSTPIDLSIPTHAVAADATKEADLFVQSLHLLQHQKSQLSPEEYNKKVAAVRCVIMQEFPDWNPDVDIDA